ncbi:MAG TPA: S41 family peptidase [Polyangiaceae bacterium]|jgi:carboxyl-terminal processing protease
MRRTLLLPLVVAACSQAPATTTAPPAPAPMSVAFAPAPATAPTASRGADPMDDERDFAVPSERFTDAQRNFDQARKTLLEQYYDPSFTEDDLYRAATAGMLERVDPKMHKWNKLVSPSESAELKNDLHGEMVGVGIIVDFDAATGYIDVKRTIPGTPADRAGVAPPDQIVTVNGKLYRGLSLRDAVADIRGKIGESVTLSILRGDKLVSVPIVREQVAYDDVSHMLLPGAVGYLQIPSFNARTSNGIRDALKDLEEKGAHALVVDLRMSPGGFFDEAVASLGPMVPVGSVVTTLHKRSTTEPFTSKTPPVFTDGPVAVLVNGRTASSAELAAAALHDLRHAMVVGSRTMGKWTVQMLDDLPNGYAVKYTIALFESPSGKSYEGVGLTPDVQVDEADDAVERAQLEMDPAKRLAIDGQLRTAVSVLGSH